MPAPTTDQQIAELTKQVGQLTRIQQLKDKQLGQQQRTIDGLTRKISAMATQIASLSSQISRSR